MRMQTMTNEEKRKVIERNLRTTMMLADGAESEIRDLLKKLVVLQHEYRDGHLFVGSEYPPKWEVRRALGSEQVYCHCPNWIFKARKGHGECKHTSYSQMLELEVPRHEPKTRK